MTIVDWAKGMALSMFLVAIGFCAGLYFGGC
jgi:hypothetical protein